MIKKLGLVLSNKVKHCRSILIIIVLIQALTIHAQQIAFPTAEGYGRFAKGGRGGDVYIVTNLQDYHLDSAKIPGSLRYGIEKQKGPRTIVFEVSGTIELKRKLEITKSYLTIAGQSAPGDGITLKDNTFIIEKAHDIIVRYIRIRLGDKNKRPNRGIDAITTNYIADVIFDHISTSWGIDGAHDFKGGRFTLQWSIYGEGLNYSIHSRDGGHSMIGSFRDITDNITVHHNIMHSSRDRHPTIGGGARTKEKAIADFRNNLIFNWNDGTNIGNCLVNVINNYYKPGETTDKLNKCIRVKNSDGKVGYGYLSGNVFPWNAEWTKDNYNAIEYFMAYGNYSVSSREEYELPAELVMGDDAPITHTAEETYDVVLNYAGASLKRDAADVRIINGIKDGTNRMINSPDEVGGWPVLVSLPAPADMDRDGMPDDWEIKNNLDPNNDKDRNFDKDKNGYTNLEEYLNSLVKIPKLVQIAGINRNRGYLSTEPIPVNAYASAGLAGNITKLSIFIDDNKKPFVVTDSSSIKTSLLVNTPGSHYMIAKALDNKGDVATDTAKFLIGSEFYTLSAPSNEMGKLVLDPPGGKYVNGTSVYCHFNATFPYRFEKWKGDVNSMENPIAIDVNSDINLIPECILDTNIFIHINFQYRRSYMPHKYMFDCGYEFGHKGNGYNYGWIDGHNFNIVKNRKHADIRYNSYNAFKDWRIDLPNGKYYTYIVCERMQNENLQSNITVNGQKMSHVDSGNFYMEYIVDNVEVTDGKLLIQPGKENLDSFIYFIDIKRKMEGENLLFIYNGSGDGMYAEGEEIRISASMPPTRDHEFHKWIGDIMYMEDIESTSPTIRMPAKNITFTALFRKIQKQ